MCVCHGIINSSCTGAQQVKSVASKTNDVAGDGTTTATVLARAIYSEGCKAVAAGMNPLDLRRFGYLDYGDSVISEEAGFKLEDIGKNGDFSALGNCKKITVTKNDTVVLDGMG